MAWVDVQYPPGTLLVTSSGTVTNLVTAFPFDDGVVDEIRSIDGVRDAHGIRLIDGSIDDRTVVVQGRDFAAGDQVPPAGEVLLSDNLARSLDARAGTIIEVDSPTGAMQVRVGGVVADLLGGDLGTVILPRSEYALRWRDSTVTRVHVALEHGADAAAVQAEIHRRFAETHRLRAMNADEFRGMLSSLIDSAFTGSYALVFVAFTVSFVAITNFLLAALVDRREWLSILAGVGMDGARVSRSTIAEGGLLGIVGSVLGLGAALAISLVAVFRTIPIVNGWLFDYEFPLLAALGVAAGAVLLSLVAGIIPGRLAASGMVAAGRR